MTNQEIIEKAIRIKATIFHRNHHRGIELQRSHTDPAYFRCLSIQAISAQEFFERVKNYLFAIRHNG
jgi:hypothetical protein